MAIQILGLLSQSWQENAIPPSLPLPAPITYYTPFPCKPEKTLRKEQVATCGTTSHQLNWFFLLQPPSFSASEASGDPWRPMWLAAIGQKAQLGQADSKIGLFKWFWEPGEPLCCKTCDFPFCSPMSWIFELYLVFRIQSTLFAHCLKTYYKVNRFSQSGAQDFWRTLPLSSRWQSYLRHSS